MALPIGCIGSRVNTEQSLERAKRLLSALSHSRISPPHRRTVITIIHTKNPFEKAIVNYTRTLPGYDQYTIARDISKKDLKKHIALIHPTAKKLSKRAYKDFILVSNVVINCKVLMAAPRIPGRGRADFALRLASSNSIPVFDLTSDADLKRLERLEYLNLKYDIEQEKIKVLADKKKDDFIFGLKKELKKLNCDREKDIKYVINQGLILYNEGVIKSPKILHLVIYNGMTPTVLFADTQEQGNNEVDVRRARAVIEDFLPRLRVRVRPDIENVEPGGVEAHTHQQYTAIPPEEYVPAIVNYTDMRARMYNQPIYEGPPRRNPPDGVIGRGWRLDGAVDEAEVVPQEIEIQNPIWEIAQTFQEYDWEGEEDE